MTRPPRPRPAAQRLALLRQRALREGPGLLMRTALLVGIVVLAGYHAFPL